MAHKKRIKSTPGAHKRMSDLAWLNRTSVKAMAGKVVEQAAALPLGDGAERREPASLVIEASVASLETWEAAMRVAQSRGLTIGELLDRVVSDELEKLGAA